MERYVWRNSTDSQSLEVEFSFLYTWREAGGELPAKTTEEKINNTIGEFPVSLLQITKRKKQTFKANILSAKNACQARGIRIQIFITLNYSN